MPYYEGFNELQRLQFCCINEDNAKIKASQLEAPTITENHDGTWTVMGYPKTMKGFKTDLEMIDINVPLSAANTNRNGSRYTADVMNSAFDKLPSFNYDAAPTSDIDTMFTTAVNSKLSNPIRESVNEVIKDFSEKMAEMQTKYETALKIITLQADKIKMLEAAGNFKGDLLETLQEIDARLTHVETNMLSLSSYEFNTLKSDVYNMRADIVDHTNMINVHSQNIVKVAGIVEEFLAKDLKETAIKSGVIVAESDNIAENDETCYNKDKESD